MIEVKDLCFNYPGSKSGFALRGISFTLERGEKAALIGANGSGKTTFVRCLNGLLRPVSGEVLVDGFSTKESRRLYDIRRKVGMVFQNPDNQIVTTITEREIAFGLENLGLPYEEISERVEEALKRFHLENHRNTSPHLLSGGERQRLALASVCVMQPDYLILDEPTSLLDPQGRLEVLKLLDSKIEVEKIGVLLVTQYPEEAVKFNRLIVMDQGNIVMDGKPSEVFQKVNYIRNIGLDVPVEIELENFLVHK